MDSVPSPGKSKILSELMVRLVQFTVATSLSLYKCCTLAVFICKCVSFFLYIYLRSSPPAVGPLRRLKSCIFAKCNNWTSYLHGNMFHTWPVRRSAHFFFSKRKHFQHQWYSIAVPLDNSHRQTVQCSWMSPITGRSSQKVNCKMTSCYINQ